MSSEPTSPSFPGCLRQWSQEPQLSQSDYLTLGVVLSCDVGNECCIEVCWEVSGNLLAILMEEMNAFPPYFLHLLP